jgi:hypothetical protein
VVTSADRGVSGAVAGDYRWKVTAPPRVVALTFNALGTNTVRLRGRRADGAILTKERTILILP